MSQLQVGIDIATSLSVIGAAIAFLVTQSTQSRKARFLAVRQQRVAHMSQLIADLTERLEAGANVVQKALKKSEGRDVEFSADDFTDSCASVATYIQLHSQLLFGIWATPKEEEILASILDHVVSWNQQFLDAMKAQDSAAVPDFQKLIYADIPSEVKRMSSQLRRSTSSVAFGRGA